MTDNEWEEPYKIYDIRQQVSSIRYSNRSGIEKVFDDRYVETTEVLLHYIDELYNVMAELEEELAEEKEREYDNGYEDGTEEGYDRGYDEATRQLEEELHERYNEGWEEGHSAGYNEGYEIGWDEGCLEKEKVEEWRKETLKDKCYGFYEAIPIVGRRIKRVMEM